jgi:hypothetical protein
VVQSKVDPEGIDLAPSLTRDVRSVGHPGTGDVEIAIDGDEDPKWAKPLLLRSYEESKWRPIGNRGRAQLRRATMAGQVLDNNLT